MRISMVKPKLPAERFRGAKEAHTPTKGEGQKRCRYCTYWCGKKFCNAKHIKTKLQTAISQSIFVRFCQTWMLRNPCFTFFQMRHSLTSFDDYLSLVHFLVFWHAPARLANDVCCMRQNTPLFGSKVLQKVDFHGGLLLWGSSSYQATSNGIPSFHTFEKAVIESALLRRLNKCNSQQKTV